MRRMRCSRHLFGLRSLRFRRFEVWTGSTSRTLAVDVAPEGQKTANQRQRHGKQASTMALMALNQQISAYAKESLWEEAINRLFSKKTVDVVSFNATIKACGKGTHWQLSTYLLKQMVVQEVSPDIISYNTAIGSCEKESQWHLALDLFEEMCSVRLTPDSITFATVLRVCEWNRALFLLQEMLEESVQPNQQILGTAVHVCEKGSQWQEALNLLEGMMGMQEDEAKLSGATFSAGMKAAKRGQQWQWAVHLLQMTSQIGPRQMNFETALDLCARAEQWSMVLEVFASMSATNLWPRSGHLYSIIRSCEKTGRWQLALHLLDRVWTGSQGETVDYGPREEDHQSAIRRLAMVTLQSCESAGQMQVVRQLKRRMRKAKIRPENIQQALSAGSAGSTDGSTNGSTGFAAGSTDGSTARSDGSLKSTPKLLILASDVSDVSQDLRQWLQGSVAVEVAQRRHSFHCSIQGTRRSAGSQVLALLQRWRLWATWAPSVAPHMAPSGWRLELEVTRRDLALLRDLEKVGFLATWRRLGVAHKIQKYGTG